MESYGGGRLWLLEGRCTGTIARLQARCWHSSWVEHGNRLAIHFVGLLRLLGCSQVGQGGTHLAIEMRTQLGEHFIQETFNDLTALYHQ